ncbi:outer membrane efflux protein [Thermodesulfobium narugense DSM 14796]|uniref:Outer membrane efflux protein n=1 Tax=Thermodesulfobium narugense DSM 14796 TaxID=747365 RepID=M1E4Y0_9BACT|nr:TolC family protein [Thermodesulfobium narugense]AEE14667.1 outer membrane efflux protein [Thermodesulfobium narugense DSM 14796]
MRVIFFLLFFIFLTPKISFSAPMSLDLSEAIQYALVNNHELKSLSESIVSKEADLGIAQSSYLPKLSLSETYLRTNNPTYAFMAKLNEGRFTQNDFEINSLNNPSSINDYQTTFTVDQLIFSRKALLAIDMAKKELQAQKLNYQRKKEEIVYKVIKSYLEVQTAKEYLDVAQKALDDALEHEKIAKINYKVGLSVYSDVLRAETSVLAAKEKLVSAKKNFEISQRSLGLVLGIGENVVPSGNFDLPLKLQEEEYYKNASLSRADLKAIELRNKIAKKNIELATSSYLPYIGLSLTYQMNDHSSIFGSEGSSYQFLTYLSWNIFDGAKRENEIKKAKAEQKMVEENLKSLEDAISLEVYSSYLGVKEAKENLELAKGALVSAEEDTKIILHRYQNALSPFIDLLDAQTNLDNIRANLVDKENKYFMSLVDLDYKSGTLLSELGIK